MAESGPHIRNASGTPAGGERSKNAERDVPEGDAGDRISGGRLDPLAAIMARVHRLRPEGRRLMGTNEEVGTSPTLASIIGESGAGWYALIALSVFAALDEATGYIISALGPDISNSLGVPASVFSMLATQRQIVVGITALQFASIFYKRRQRALIAKQFGFQYGAILIAGSLVTWAPAMSAVVGSTGAGAAVIDAAHRPLIMDMYPPGARLRALSFHSGAGVVGAIVGTALVAVLSGPAGLSWRGTFLVLGSIFLPLSLIGLWLRDPGYGRFDTDRVAALVHVDPHAELVRPDDPSELRFWEAVRRVWLIPTVRRLLVVWGVLGVAVTPLVSYQGFFLEEQFNYTSGERATFYAIALCFSLPALWFVSRHGERAWRRDPERLVQLTAGALVALALGLILAVMPLEGVSLIGFSVVFAAEAVAIATLSLVMLSIVRPRSRPIAAALAAIFFGLVGGEGGSLLLGGIASVYPASIAIGIMAIPALGAAALLRRAAVKLDADLDKVVEEVLEDEAVHSVIKAGGEIPLLACRGVDFSYGQIQVLFGVDLTVREGEMLALLGVNGAGKSTLLKVVSGIGLPSRGSVRFTGSDITYLDAERRVRMGITQIPGGRAVFGPMTVAENLYGFGYSLGRDKRRLEAAVDAAFETFPRLAERRNQHALTLSGGEQQMLGLCKALILEPRLLLIDELSLGLAPLVVDQLLDMVRQINAKGVAVILVEQSVSIALSVVDHAYFMEKGAMRFDGAASDLLERDDLLRAVFLGAAAVGEGGS